MRFRRLASAVALALIGELFYSIFACQVRMSARMAADVAS
jgi:hypothetical protein